MKAKRLITALMAGALLLAFTAGVAPAAERKARLKVAGMHCAKDEFVVGGILDTIDGVEGYSIDLNDETAVVTFDDAATSIEEMKTVIDEDVYTVEEAVLLEE
jgi:copper chaperone CopZ